MMSYGNKELESLIIINMQKLGIAAFVTLGQAQQFLQVESNLSTPTVIFHGFGRHCKDNFRGDQFAVHIEKKTGAHAECVEIDADFNDPDEAYTKSVFNNFLHYTQAACDAVASNNFFNKGQEFNLIGFSQGSLVARNLVENCPELKVRNLWTIGGPHRGVHAVPHCESGLWCEVLQELVDGEAYDPFF